jgi:O-antigen ligase
MRNIKFTIVLAAGMLAVGVFLSSKVESIGGRFKEIFVTAWTPPVGIYHNSTNLRIGVYFCSIPLLKDNWLIGLGTGDVQAALNACYKERGYSDVMYKDQLNTHNEYLNVWLNTGIVGFIVFLATLVIPCRAAYLKHNYFYLSFIILVMIVFLTENVLERQKGIVFYSFFNSLLAFNLSIFHLPSPSRDHE